MAVSGTHSESALGGPGTQGAGPAPTGSRRTGRERAFALFPAANMAGMVRWLRVPMLIFTPPQMVESPPPPRYRPT